MAAANDPAMMRIGKTLRSLKGVKKMNKPKTQPPSPLIAFVQGAAWWEYKSRGATMWSSDRVAAEQEAANRVDNGTLGKLPNDPSSATKASREEAS